MAVPVVRLLVLGIIRLREEAHGYAVHRELVDWHVESWTSVKPGSIYHALKQLTKEGKLQATAQEESIEGPGRTLYCLTPAGETEFRTLLESALGSFSLEALSAGIAFMESLPRDRVIELLRDQHRRATENRMHLEGLMPNHPWREDPPHTQDLLALWSGGLAATANWTAGMILRLQAGDYVMDGEARYR